MSPQLTILRETKQWIAIDKPAGLNVEQLWDYPSAENYVRRYLETQGIRQPYVGIVHRLDRPVSGVLLIAKKKSALRHLNEQFAKRQVRKEYWALTAQPPANARGELHHFILKLQKEKRAVAYPHARKGAVTAKLRYEVMKATSDSCWIKVWPVTGKFHQIRVQLAAVGASILGDHKYGGLRIANHPNTIALHAAKLTFRDPLEARLVSVTVSPPSDGVWKNFQTLSSSLK